MNSRLVIASSLIFLILCLNLITLLNSALLVYANDNNDDDDEEYAKINSFYENFENGINKWELINEGKWRAIKFETQSARTFVYEGEKSLVFSARTNRPKLSAICGYFYDFTEEGFVVPLEKDTRFIFSWYIPNKSFSYQGVFLSFDNGKNGYYISHFYGTSLNSSSSYFYLYDESSRNWVTHERDVYEDFGALWDPAEDVDITGIGVILADIYSTGMVQTIYYDSLFLGRENETLQEFALSVTPSSQTIFAGEETTYNIDIVSVGGFDAEISLNISGLPEGVSGFIEPSSGVPPFQAVLAINSNTNASTGDYALTISALHGERVKSLNVTFRIRGSQELKFKFITYPNTQIIIPGDYAEYDIDVLISDTAETSIGFSIQGLPDDSRAEFNPNSVSISQANEVTLSLTIFTEYSSTPGTYTLIIKGESTVDEPSTYYKDVVLVISGSSLDVEISTDKPSYLTGEIVHIFGNVSNSEKVSLLDISVFIQVMGQPGNDIHVSSAFTDENGTFSDSFVIGENVESGTYMILITTSKSGYRNAYGQYSFAVGESATPSVAIKKIYFTGANENNKTIFGPRETVRVVMAITNGGADLDKGIIWVGVNDPNGIPQHVVSIQMKIENTVKKQSGPIEIAISFQLSSDAISGLYSINGFVSDKLVSQGGKFLAYIQGSFQID